MAKGNPFLGTVRGSFGDLTLKTYRGKQVLSRKPTNPHNPRTSKQMYQRMFFATVGKARNALKFIVNHSFENVAHGADSLGYFTKLNVAFLRDKTKFDYSTQKWVAPEMSFVGPKSTTVAWNPFRISEGSLPALSSAPLLQENLPTWGFNDPNLYKQIVPMWGSLDQSKVSIDEMLGLLLSNYDIYTGDFITLVVITNKVGTSTPYETKLRFVRFKVCDNRIETGDEENPYTYTKSLVPSNVNGVQYEVPNVVFDSGIKGGIQNDDKSQTMEYGKWTPYIGFFDGDEFEIQIDFEGGSFEMHGGGLIPKGEQLVAFAWIHSSEDGDRLLTSTQSLILADPTGLRIPLNLDIDTAFDLWTKEGKSVGDARYLLEGGDV